MIHNSHWSVVYSFKGAGPSLVCCVQDPQHWSLIGLLCTGSTTLVSRWSVVYRIHNTGLSLGYCVQDPQHWFLIGLLCLGFEGARGAGGGSGQLHAEVHRSRPRSQGQK